MVPELEQIEAESGADIRGAGETGLIRVVASGGASIDLIDLVARDVVVDVSGGAVLLVAATDSVTGKASGGADVDVYGRPTTVDVDTSGGANVVQRG